MLEATYSTPAAVTAWRRDYGAHDARCNEIWEQQHLDGNRLLKASDCWCKPVQHGRGERSGISRRDRVYDRDRMIQAVREEMPGLSQVATARILRIAVDEDEPRNLDRPDRRLYHAIHRIAKRRGIILALLRGLAFGRQVVRTVASRLSLRPRDMRHWWWRRRYGAHALSIGSEPHPGSGEMGNRNAELDGSPSARENENPPPHIEQRRESRAVARDKSGSEPGGPPIGWWPSGFEGQAT